MCSVRNNNRIQSRNKHKRGPKKWRLECVIAARISLATSSVVMGLGSSSAMRLATKTLSLYIPICGCNTDDCPASSGGSIGKWTGCKCIVRTDLSVQRKWRANLLVVVVMRGSHILRPHLAFDSVPSNLYLIFLMTRKPSFQEFIENCLMLFSNIQMVCCL